jgi:hypothetical protein
MHRIHVAVLLVLAIGIGVIVPLGAPLVAGPESSLLLPEAGARWVGLDAPLSPDTRKVRTQRVVFSRRFSLGQMPDEARLRVRAFRTATLRVNGRRIDADPDEVDLTPFLHAGQNELAVEVENDRGPPALLAYARDLEVSTPGGWRASADGSEWTRARPLAERPPFAFSREFPSAAESLARKLPYLAAFFLLGATGSLLLARHAQAGRVRWVLLGAWVALCANNLWKTPLSVGFDVLGHYRYIAYIVERGGLPLATEGWSMFQAPLFYAIAALQWSLTLGPLGPEQTAYLLRVLPMLCGLAQVEIAFRASRTVFPRRNDLQIIGTAVGGFLPLNIYISQAVGNEPLSGCLTAWLILLAFGLLAEPTRGSLPRACLGLGVVFGLALLAKVSAVVLLPVILLLIVSVSHLRRSSRRELFLSTTAFFLSSGLLAGWYYARNWVLLGRPFVGNWERGLGWDWWQDPGYRLLGDFVSFGESLRYPVYSSLMGFWDGLYSTFWLDGLLSGNSGAASSAAWNDEFMLATALLSLPLTLAALVGIAHTLRRPFSEAKRTLLFALACLGAYFVAYLHMCLAVPIYSNVKSSYALGILPCVAILIASAFRLLPRNAASRAIVSGYLFSWLAFAYVSYFVW